MKATARELAASVVESPRTSKNFQFVNSRIKKSLTPLTKSRNDRKSRLKKPEGRRFRGLGER
jgi:hypothetical protein